MKTIPYLCTLGTLVVFLGCDKNSDNGAGGSADATTRSSSSAAGSSVDTQTTQTRSPASRDTADTSASPDNTGKNVRDRSDAALTSGDQNENKQDLEITRQIRRAITSNDDLSQEAKNIKIITTNGKVTLRGPVNSDQERKTIESIAQKVQGATVDDQLEVKATNQ